MPEYDDTTLDTLLSAAFAALPPTIPSPVLRSRVMQAVQAEAEQPIPMRVQIVEQRQANRLLRVTWQTATPVDSLIDTTVPINQKRIEWVRTAHVFNRKGNP